MKKRNYYYSEAAGIEELFVFQASETSISLKHYNQSKQLHEARKLDNKQLDIEVLIQKNSVVKVSNN